jgi:hypothetical protein
MPRRTTKNVTNIRGTGQVDYCEVWRVFECFSPGCDALLKMSESEIERQTQEENLVTLRCPKCGFANDRAILDRAARWKYCRVCEWLQPLDNFHKHKPNTGSFRSGRQLECKGCKNLRINPSLNPLRTSDQHRESSERRRLYELLSGDAVKLDDRAVYERFGGRCFACGKALAYRVSGVKDFDLDHTLPAKLLWPLTTESATLLCNDCNNAKHGAWPSEFYRDSAKLRQLAVLTGVPFDLLSGPPHVNRQAIEGLRANVDGFLNRWIAYPDEIKRIRALIQQDSGVDIFADAKAVPAFLRD